jgi:DDE superfamily endonuclease
MTVDGTDCMIQEPLPFSPKWYSHKFEGPGVRYEIGVGIQTGWIVWVNGPFPCGEWSDLKIAKDDLFKSLAPNEMVVADGGYRDGGWHADTPNGLNDYMSRIKSVARARHETINKRIKQFNVLRSTFRHDLEKHGFCFHAAANITQLIIEHEEPPFQVEYYDR